MPRVLSIQSSVVHGVVGLGAATLPLQLHGWEVSPLATVAFSNHSGYPNRGGAALSAEGLADLLEGLAANGVGLGDPGAYDAVLTGYVGRAGTVTALGEALAKARRQKPGTLAAPAPAPAASWRLVVDPVLGDEGALYVPPDVVPAYLPLLAAADVLLPNATEAVALLNAAGSGGGEAVPPITTEAGALAALEALHALGPPVVIITSTSVQEWPGAIVLYASVSDGPTAAAAPTRLRVRIPARPRSFTGTGDLLAALVTARLGPGGGGGGRHGRPAPPTPAALAAALEGAVAGVQAVLARTAAAADAAAPALAAAGVPAGREGRRHPAALAAAELRLVESAAELVNPPPGPAVEWI